MRREWAWIEVATVDAVHDEQRQQHGGSEGGGDADSLASALAHPQQLAAAYSEPDLFDLAAAYAHGIARNHPFADGNTRTAWVVARVFLMLHGYERSASDEACCLTMQQLAAGALAQEAFAAWLRENSAPV